MNVEGLDLGARYRRLVRPVATGASEEQRWAFAESLSDDHSWYKKLPLISLGEPFFVFLDPHVRQKFVQHEFGGMWHKVIATESPASFGGRMLQLDMPDALPLPGSALRGGTTVDFVRQFGHWRYWNYGPADQPRYEAVAQAARSIVIQDETGTPVPVPESVLREGLVYLRGTISPLLGPREDTYEDLRRQHGLPTHFEDRCAQLEEIVEAMARVLAWALRDES
jgi:hypothetical protein